MNTGLLRGFSSSATTGVPPTFVTGGTASSGIITIPAGAQVGDIAIYAGAGGGGGITAPAGWMTAYNGSIYQTDADKCAVLWKRLTAGEPGSSITVNGSGVSAIAVYRSAADPAVVSSTDSAASSITVPVLGSLAAGVRVVRAAATVKGGSNSLGEPVYPTSASRASLGAAWWSAGLGDLVAVGGSVGAETITSGGQAVRMRGVQLALAGA